VTPQSTLPTPAAELALERSEEICRSLVAGIPAAVAVLTDARLNVRMALGSAWTDDAPDPAAAAGMPLRELVAGPLYDLVLPSFTAALAGDTSSFDVIDGRRAFHATAVPLRMEDDTIVGVLAFGWDEGPLLQAERAVGTELKRRLGQQSAVARLGELALRRPDLVTLFDAASSTVAAALDADLVALWEPTGRDAVMRVSAGVGWPAGFVGSEHEVAHFADAEGRAPYADGPVVIDDLPANTSWRAAPLRAQGVVSLAQVLIGPPEAPNALIGAFSRTPREFTPHDLDFLLTVGHVLNGAIEGRRTEEQIRHDALHDALTGLPNRTLLLERLRQALARTERDGRRLALFFLDVDHLKVLNDSLGHHAGDELLRAIGPRLRDILRPADTVARFGGDEFAVLCEEVADEQVAHRLAERLVGAFGEPFEVCGEPRFGSVSVGVVVSDPEAPRGPDELLSDADAALYRAKERGRGRHEAFDSGMRARLTSRLRVETDLRRALEGEGRIWVAYQPFYRLPDATIAGVEALVRWDHPHRGPVPPSDFIHVAEDSGLIVELGERVLRTACLQVAAWHADVPGAADLSLSVNVSARQVALPGLVGTVERALSETGLDPSSLGLELTEGLLLEETPATVQTLQGLQAMGVRLMLDDFGTGYSSLGYLRRYVLDVLKIDRAFVNDLGRDGEGDGAIVEAIVGMAKALGMRVIPEGVETQGQLARLTALGCDYAQGFLLSRPLPAEDIRTLLGHAAP
jgi:diguanylate cyclase (GGDEF)-like protein